MAGRLGWSILLGLFVGVVGEKLSSPVTAVVCAVIAAFFVWILYPYFVDSRQ
jgi:uncharacterized membrane protein (DUF4010 family)